MFFEGIQAGKKIYILFLLFFNYSFIIGLVHESAILIKSGRISSHLGNIRSQYSMIADNLTIVPVEVITHL